MATRAATHGGSADASAVTPAVTSTMQADKGSVGLSTGAAAAAQSVPQTVLDSSVYEPSSLSAFANAAPVAAATAGVTPLQSPASSARRVAVSAPPAVMTRSKLGRHSSKFGTVNYSIDEMRRLNEKVRAVMPIASEDWLHVAYQFNYMRPESIPYREVESLKRKFKKMYCSRSTVSGKLPDYVQEAKELRTQINQRSERAQIQLEQTNSDSQSEADPQDAACEDQARGDEAAESTADRVSSSDPTAEPLADNGDDGSTEAAVAVGASNEETRTITARLRVMEEEYHRSMTSKRGSSASATSVAEAGAASAVAGAAAAYPETAFASQVAAPLNAASAYTGGVASGDSTAGIINLLKHSIERKRRTIEEQMLSESERVRKERKKRKMEQVLYNIHREHEIATGGGASSGVAGSSDAVASSEGLGATPFPPHHPLLLSAASSSSVGQGHNDAPSSSSPSSSLGVMEIVLSYMVTQQQEATRRAQLEDEQRRVELEQREQRRRAKELQRRRDKHEMMLVMAALLQDSFPEELRHYLDPASVSVDVDDADQVEHASHSTRRGAPKASGSSTNGDEVATSAAAIAASLAPVTETLL